MFGVSLPFSRPPTLSPSKQDKLTGLGEKGGCQGEGGRKKCLPHTLFSQKKKTRVWCGGGGGKKDKQEGPKLAKNLV